MDPTEKRVLDILAQSPDGATEDTLKDQGIDSEVMIRLVLCRPRPRARRAVYPTTRCAQLTILHYASRTHSATIQPTQGRVRNSPR